MNENITLKQAFDDFIEAIDTIEKHCWAWKQRNACGHINEHGERRFKEQFSEIRTLIMHKVDLALGNDEL